MKKNIKIAILIVFIGLFSACDKTVEKKAPIDITVFFTANINGYIEPCGCFVGQRGGMTRVNTKILEEAGKENIIVDAGNAAEGPEDFNFVHYKHVLKAFKKMNYDAVNIGHQEAAFSLNELNEIAKSTEVNVISANLKNAQTNELIFKPYVELKRGDYKVIILGVLDPAGLDDCLDEELKVDDMETVINSHLETLKNYDMRILLAFTSEEKMRKLAKEFYEFEMIIGGNVDQPAQDLIEENRSIISYTAKNARNVGYIKGKLEEKNFKSIDFNIQFLAPAIKESKEIRDISEIYKDVIGTMDLKIDNPGHDSLLNGVKKLEYVGSQACQACHSQAYDTWKNSKHAHAFDSLIQTKSHTDPKCVACHTVGFGSESGFKRSFAKEKKMVHVGCESCHGPGSEHVKQRMSGEKVLFHFRPLGKNDCLQCHHGEFSRKFEWDKFWPHVKHGKESSYK